MDINYVVCVFEEAPPSCIPHTKHPKDTTTPSLLELTHARRHLLKIKRYQDYEQYKAESSQATSKPEYFKKCQSITLLKSLYSERRSSISDARMDMDKDVFENLILQVLPTLHSIAWSYYGNAYDSGDAIQDAILKAWTKRGSLRNADLFRPWISRILVNRCKSGMLRRAKLEAIPMNTLPDRAVPEYVPDGELYEAILVLSPKERVPLIMYHVEGYSTGEIARVLRLPKGTVTYRLMHARRRLRALLEQGGYTSET
jgi:RNA polymerase sigma-70 factor (ECF subfamily)